MKVLRWLIEEAKALAAVTLYFAACFAVVMLLKQLLLAEYGIEFSGLATAILVALVTAKVVIVLQKVPLTHWLRNQPPIADVLARTAFYTLATVVALLLERAFEARSEHGGFAESLASVLEHRDVAQVWATTICVGLAFLAFNAFGVIRREIGGRRLWRIFFRGTVGRQAEGEETHLIGRPGSPP
jgi:hypothetical protein